MEFHLDSGALTVALAMVIGVLSVAVARHMRLPGIVLLLGAGVALGPDGANIIRPATLGEGLQTLVGFAVAVILFEGGLNLNLKQLRRQAGPIRRLVTVGALVTAAGGAVAARLFMGWSWPISVLFGTLVIVTGPTVINPLLRRIRVRHDVATILEAEGIFIDAVGATIAVMALEFALRPSGEEALHAVLGVAERMGLGAVIGLAGGALLALLLRRRRVVPEGLENILSLGVAVAVFQVANAFIEESGITAAIAAGMVVGNTDSHVSHELREFKEQLTTLFIATLFLLLSADVRVADVINLGVPGLLTVAALMFLVRPATVFVSTVGGKLDRKARMFLSWLAPRGIVAAAVASLFATELAHHGSDIGIQLRALVFLVIGCTVVLQGLSGGVVAQLLRLRRRSDWGYVILGANGVGRKMGEVLRGGDQEVVFVDDSPVMARAAQDAGFRVVFGNALQDRTLLRAQVDARRAVIAVTPNETINYVFAQRVRELDSNVPLYVALETEDAGVTDEMIRDLDAYLLFGHARRVDRWREHLRHRDAQCDTWRLNRETERSNPLSAPPELLLAIAGTRGDRALVMGGELTFKKNDRVTVTYDPGREDDARAWLNAAGWVREAGAEKAAPTPSAD